MTDIKTILINMVVLSIFIFSMMSFIIIVQVEAEIDSSLRITNNSVINDSYGFLLANLSQQSGAEGALNSLEDVPPTQYVGD